MVGGTGNAEEHHLLARPLLAGIVLLGNAAGGRVRVGDGSPPAGAVSHVPLPAQHSPAGCLLELDAVGEAVADFKRCHCVCWAVGRGREEVYGREK